MIKNLRGFEAFVISSRLFKKPLRGHDGPVEADLTRLKRGVRYCNSLNHHEAFYRALDNARLLDAFHTKFPDVFGLNLSEDLKSNARRCASQADQYLTNSKRATNKEDEDRYFGHYQHYDSMSKAYTFMSQVEADAKAILSSVLKKPSDNIPWNKLTSFQLFEYDVATNSFVEINEKGERV